MTQSGPLKENSPPLSSTDNKNKVTTLITSARKEQLDKENTSRSTGKQGKNDLNQGFATFLCLRDNLKSLDLSIGGRSNNKKLNLYFTECSFCFLLNEQQFQF